VRTIVSLNSGWKYRPDFSDAYRDPVADLGGWESICLPHANLELPFNGFDEASYQFVSTYVRDIDIGPDEKGRRLFLDFGAVMASCEAWLNGERLGGHAGGYTPFSFEITRVARPGERNRLVVKVDSREDPAIPPFGFVIDYLCYGGIYREVALRSQAQAYIADLWARPGKSLEAEKELGIEIAIDSAENVAEASLSCRLEKIDAQGRAAGLVAALSLPLGFVSVSGSEPRREKASFASLPGVELWDVDAPVLYRLSVSLESEGRQLDRAQRDFGFRDARWTKAGFFLNGRRLRLRGLNRHQSFPYSGYAMPARAQARDADILKNEIGVNIVRTSHYPQSAHFLDRCDRIGLLVLEELPGWQHIGDEAWKDRACSALSEMILRDRSRPSIVLWGVRINESRDDHGFYLRTNEIAHRLDPDRASGGIRNFARSEALEDVYTYNDFSHSGGKVALRDPAKVVGKRMPYLVTEHNGHMFPTKRFDNEERLREHALRHARVLSAAASIPGISGAIGWCAFDYNTHKDFGSGDRICYHGVADMFRIPKYAAWAYSSQLDPARRVVLEAASLFAKGERSAACLLPIEVYTNCDHVVLYKGGKRVGSFFPAKKEFPGLAHPPVIIRDLIGDQLEEEGFSRRDSAAIKRVIEKVLSAGLQSLRWLEYLSLGWILLKRRMGRAEAEKLMIRFSVGWGLKDDSFELAGCLSGKEVIRRRYGSDAFPQRLAAEADDSVLSSGDWDCTRVVLRLLDQYGNLCLFASEAVEIKIEGPASAIGPARLPLIGGCNAFWLKTTGTAGKIRVTSRGGRFASNPIEIVVC
jgi:beta-galactosidase